MTATNPTTRTRRGSHRTTRTRKITILNKKVSVLDFAAAAFAAIALVGNAFAYVGWWIVSKLYEYAYGMHIFPFNGFFKALTVSCLIGAIIMLAIEDTLREENPHRQMTVRAALAFACSLAIVLITGIH